MTRELSTALLICFAGTPTWAQADGASALQKPVETTLPALKPSESGNSRLNRFALGLNYIGGQARYHLSPKWAGELHLVTGSGDSNEGRVQSIVIGLRSYRFYSPYRNFKFYAGFEGDYVQSNLNGIQHDHVPNAATTANNFGNASGLAFGGFGGVEFRIHRRIAIDFDCGPYLISLKEKATKISETSWDFIVNTALVVYLF